MFISLPGDDLKTSLRLFVRSWILCIFCFHICVFVAIKIKFKPNITVSLNGILKLLNDLNPHKAAGPDQLKPLVLQRLREVIAPVLQVIYQKSLDTGRVPKDWSTAYVCPLFKKGDTSLASNYRPISLTSILCKVQEHIVTTNVVSHMDQYNLLYDLQHGFRSKHSCETQLVTLIEDLMRNSLAGSQTDLVLLDF